MSEWETRVERVVDYRTRRLLMGCRKQHIEIIKDFGELDEKYTKDKGKKLDEELIHHKWCTQGYYQTMVAAFSSPDVPLPWQTMFVDNFRDEDTPHGTEYFVPMSEGGDPECEEFPEGKGRVFDIFISLNPTYERQIRGLRTNLGGHKNYNTKQQMYQERVCLLYTSDSADE